jgi:hypothetical protein
MSPLAAREAAELSRKKIDFPHQISSLLPGDVAVHAATGSIFASFLPSARLAICRSSRSAG